LGFSKSFERYRVNIEHIKEKQENKIRLHPERKGKNSAFDRH
jgi:hypothetical protein